MAIIGSAEVIVTPITRGFEATLRRNLQGMRGTLAAQGRRTGDSFGTALQEGISNSLSNNIFGKFQDGLRNLAPGAEAAREKFQTLVRVGYVLQAVIGGLVGGISSLVVSLGTLVGVLGRAAPAVAVLAAGFVTLRTAMATAKFGFGDIASAVKQATEPTAGMRKTIEDLREEFQQLQFDAEQAALSEGKAALNLESALENLRRVQDLPPNSRARREAQLAYEEAELSYRRAKDRAADLNKEVAKGPEALKDASGTDPFANLNEAQREFAEYLVTLKPLIDDLELRVSRALLPPLREAVDILKDELLPVLQRELPNIAEDTGTALRDMIEGIDYERVERILGDMNKPFGDNELGNIDLFGQLLGNILDIFLQIVEGATPLLNDFLTFLVDKTGEWSDKLEETDLVKFFGESGEYAADLGEIIGNVFEGLGNLIGLTTGPGSAGEMMLDWMKESTETFANMFSEDPEAGKQFFADAFTNARSVMSSIGALLQEIFKLADNPNIGKTFDTLKEGAPAMGEMLGKMIDAGPSFAEFIKTVTEIANKLTDDNQISAFFETLNNGAQRFNEFLDTDAAKGFLDNLGPIFARLSAFGVIFDVLRFGFEVLVGYIIFIQEPLSKFFGTLFGKKGVEGAGGAFKNLGKAVKGAGIAGLIIFIISKAVEFYNTFKDFRDMVDRTFGGVGESLGRFGESFGELWENIFGDGTPGSGLLGVLDPILKFLLEQLIPVVGFAINSVMNIITFGIDFINTTLESIIPALSSIAEGIGLLFEGDFKGALDKILEGIGLFALGVIQFVTNGIIDIINMGIRGVNDLIKVVTESKFADFLKDVLGINITGFRIPELANVDWLGDVDRANTNRDIQSSYSTSSFGGPDARAGTSSAITAGQVSARFRNMPEYAEYSKGAEVNITVNPSAQMDEKELAKMVGDRVAYAMTKGS